MKKYHWTRTTDASWVCNMPGNVTLVAAPGSTRNRTMFTRKAAPKTLWRAQASIWDEATRTISRYGRDAYGEPCATADEAKRLAEQIYEEAHGRRNPKSDKAHGLPQPMGHGSRLPAGTIKRRQLRTSN